MAQTVYLRLQINGTDIRGESTAKSLDREGSIECLSFHCGVATPRDAGGLLIGKRQYEPVRIHKYVDKSTPLLFRALCQNELVNRAEFRFYRLTPYGAEEHFYTVLLENGHISSVRQGSQDELMPSEKASPMTEEVAFVFRDITWTYETDGVTYHDSISLS